MQNILSPKGIKSNNNSNSKLINNSDKNQRFRKESNISDNT